MFMVGIPSILKMLLLDKIICKFKIPAKILLYIVKLIITIIWKHKGIRMAKTT